MIVDYKAFHNVLKEKRRRKISYAWISYMLATWTKSSHLQGTWGSFGNSDLLVIEMIQLDLSEIELIRLVSFTNRLFGNMLSISDSIEKANLLYTNSIASELFI